MLFVLQIADGAGDSTPAGGAGRQAARAGEPWCGTGEGHKGGKLKSVMSFLFISICRKVV